MRHVICGGSGTLGREIARRLLEGENNEVVILSRCELKQKQMAQDFGRNPRLSFVIGDIRDPLCLSRVFRGADAVFHVAALKHVDSMELNPEECVRTNILGTMNVADAAEVAGVRYVVFSSTDKAVDPLNVYGMSKGISERILLNRNTQQTKTRFSVFRWGNIANSRGSILPSFIESIKKNEPVYITSTEMTRFWIKIEDAVSFMLENYTDASLDDAMIPPIKCAPLMSVVESLASLLGSHPRNLKIVQTGLRPGEKLHESLRSRFEGEPMESNMEKYAFSYVELFTFLGDVFGLVKTLRDRDAEEEEWVTECPF